MDDATQKVVDGLDVVFGKLLKNERLSGKDVVAVDDAMDLIQRLVAEKLEREKESQA